MERDAEGRRAEDRDLAEYVARTMRWVRRGPRILVALFAFMTGAAGVASWLGAQASSPGQRIMETRQQMVTYQQQTDVRFETVFKMVDSVRATVDSLRADVRTQQSSAAAMQRDLKLLLSIGCRPIVDPDLRRDCVERGARR